MHLPGQSRQRLVVYSLLAGAWMLIAGWQTIEHRRVRESARTALMNRAKDISDTLGLVMRSQRRFGGVISKERLESALKDLVRPGELNSIALLNAAGDVVASAGPPIELEELELKTADRTGPRWTPDRVTVANLVDLGTNVAPESGSTNLTIVLPRPEHFGPADTNRPAGAPLEPRADRGTNATERPRFGPPRDWVGPRVPRDREGRAPFGRPFWMSEEQFKDLMQKQGVHGFVLVMSTAAVRRTVDQDLWLRGIICLLAAASVAGTGLAWSNQARTNELQIRLVRASELNARLKEMNLAAAGLAHETRNPLNIVRGLAQLIARQPDAAGAIGEKARAIIDETDRVTAQLSEFINYSRPREVRLAAVSLNLVVGEVVRALGFDLEEKAIRLNVAADLPVIQADEQLLRQALFNLLLNAVQAVPREGVIDVASAREGTGEARLDISDNGPGVVPERRAEIFKPYVTTQEKGTGLGLAIVQQIVLAHGWEIACLPHEPTGATFRLTHLRRSDSGPAHAR